ncbi:unnamed protein product [Rangifer tarandus platyrhynchus]|uniref:Uncharacterized protein n=2 Tax=Rangifer tarandus platyrhynchus TaxID=3082113 RepID=A0AC59YXM6_RANTA|nr:unnamed protein product [Rangifer tarandus platyrhynchus]
MTTGKTIALTRQTFVGKVMSLLFNTLSRLVVTFLPRSKRLLVSLLQSPSTVILEPRKIKSATKLLNLPKHFLYTRTPRNPSVVGGSAVRPTTGEPYRVFPSWSELCLHFGLHSILNQNMSVPKSHLFDKVYEHTSYPMRYSRS